ncbi:MAG: hypothetical protein K5686_07405 [Lachnospiraceae bacterium]|nr:hypothetical protein [Lachnospiraceae bacterium]
MKDLFCRIKNGESSNAELTLSGICLVLIGVLIGMLIAPARFFVAGSFNGNQGSLKAPEKMKKKKPEASV